MGFNFGRGFLDPAGNEAPGQPVERALAGLGMLADNPMLLARRAVVARRRFEQRLDQGRDLETENLGIALLGDAAAHEGSSNSAGVSECVARVGVDGRQQLDNLASATTPMPTRPATTWSSTSPMALMTS